MDRKSNLTIGKIAKTAAVGVETIKFYEKKGLLAKPPKPTKGFRLYPEDYASRISFIKRAQDLGFTLREVKELLKLKVDKAATCGQVKKRTELKIDEIEKKIEDLKKMKRTLQQIRDCCMDGSLSLTDCPILDCFDNKGGCL